MGDQHGSLRALLANLQGLGLIDQNRNWLAEDTDLILLGDLFADRFRDDFELAKLILNLREKIAAAGGEMHVLMGNHDLEALNFIVGGLCQPFENIHRLRTPNSRPVMAGIESLENFLGLHAGKELERCFEERPNDPDFLRRFGESENGSAVVEVLGMMKARHRAGKVLFQHTPPTHTTLALLPDSTLDEDFNIKVASLLKGEDPFPSSSAREAWVGQLYLWLAASNRTVPPEDDTAWQTLFDRGIDTVCSGHDYDLYGYWACQKGNRPYHLIGADYGFGLGARDYTSPTSMLSAVHFLPKEGVVVNFPHQP